MLKFNSLNSLFGSDFSAVLAFSISLLKSREIQQTELGITIIEALFDSFQQPSKQQEILDALINTVKSSGGGSLPALRTLESLSISSPKVIAQYKQFFACLLDSIESMDEFSLKKLYIIFSILQFPEVEVLMIHI